MDEVNEESTAYLTVSFYAADGALEAPTSISYRIDDKKEDVYTEVRAPTSPGAASSIVITLSTTDNTLIDTTQDFEYRKVTISVSYGVADGLNAEFTYRIKNLAKI